MPGRLILTSEFVASVEKVKELLGPSSVGAKAAFIPTAAFGEGFEPDGEREALAKIGLQVTTLDLRGKTPADAEAALADAAVIHVSGGNTFFLMQHMLSSGFPEIIKKRLSEGATYIGSSAGSIVCSPDLDFITPMDDPSKAPELPDTKGLGLIDFLLLPHLDHKWHGDVARNRIASYRGATPMLALYDAQIALVEGKVVKVVS